MSQQESYNNPDIIRELLNNDTFGKWTLDQIEEYCAGSFDAFAPLISIGHLEDPSSFLRYNLSHLEEDEQVAAKNQVSQAIPLWNRQGYETTTLIEIANFSLHADIKKTILPRHLGGTARVKRGLICSADTACELL